MERYAYGTGLREKSRLFGLTVVSIYLTIVMAYFLHVAVISPLLRRPFPTIKAWGDISELIMIA